ncbi:MAG TPA: suppressor of fused domain protein [Anaeromyxobacter sp.]|nr:suppressor of fused domain protein [Anaeromyxobacter sp.]
MTSQATLYFEKIDALVGATGTYYPIGDAGDPQVVAVASYADVPEEGHTTSFTYGLSAAAHPQWKETRPELIVSVRSTDAAWGLCIGDAIHRMRRQSAFPHGTVVDIGAPISDESPMSCFLVFDNSLLEEDDSRIVLPGWTVRLSQAYPIHAAEARLVERLGVQRFFFDLDIDFYDVRRPPYVSGLA